MSQPSSPTQSRTGSPNRQQQQIPPTSNQHRNNRGMRNTRTTTETTPPPIVSSNAQQTQGSGTINSYMGNEIMVQTLSKNFDDVSLVEKSSAHKHKNVLVKTRFSSKDN
jgi:hypothetical protein